MYWALEALTTDQSGLGNSTNCPSGATSCPSTFPPRYYLLTHAAIYEYNFFNGIRYLRRGYGSGWATDYVYDTFIGLYRARAGAPINFGLTVFTYENHDPGDPNPFTVQGYHYWFDPPTASYYYAGESIATDCNFNQFGFNYGLYR